MRPINIKMMLKNIFAILLLLHGTLHIMGFTRAFGWWDALPMSAGISRPSGILWLCAALLFIIAAVLLLANSNTWWAWALAATVLSQALFVIAWHDAKYGTIVNVLIALVVIAAFGSWQYEKHYRADVTTSLKTSGAQAEELLTEQDIASLPPPVQRYLTYTGAVNMPKVRSAKIVMEGVMRQRGKEWFPIHAEQYNFFDSATRLFFMKAKMYGLIVPGYHQYENGTAGMQVRLFGLIPVAKHSGKDMDRAETVTLFNDMCFLAPATLIDKRIYWETLDETSVKAVFTVSGIAITATLHFNQKGQLVNFISDDRFEVNDHKYYRFSTPVNEYGTINGFHLARIVEACWQYPDGWFAYGKFAVQEVIYNVK